MANAFSQGPHSHITEITSQPDLETESSSSVNLANKRLRWILFIHSALHCGSHLILPAKGPALSLVLAQETGIKSTIKCTTRVAQAAV